MAFLQLFLEAVVLLSAAADGVFNLPSDVFEDAAAASPQTIRGVGHSYPYGPVHQPVWRQKTHPARQEGKDQGDNGKNAHTSI